MDKKVLAEKLGILQDMAAKQENFLELTACWTVCGMSR